MDIRAIQFGERHEEAFSIAFRIGFVLTKSDPLKSETMTQDITGDRRKEVFFTLVSSQDNGTSVQDSRALVAAQFDLVLAEVLAIERAGIAEKWPPLHVDGDQGLA